MWISRALVFPAPRWMRATSLHALSIFCVAFGPSLGISGYHWVSAAIDYYHSLSAAIDYNLRARSPRGARGAWRAFPPAAPGALRLRPPGALGVLFLPLPAARSSSWGPGALGAGLRPAASGALFVLGPWRSWCCSSSCCSRRALRPRPPVRRRPLRGRVSPCGR